MCTSDAQQYVAGAAKSSNTSKNTTNSSSSSNYNDNRIMLIPMVFLFLASTCGVNGVCELGYDVLRKTSWSGSITSPGHSRGLYPGGQECYWELKVSKGSKVSLTFQTFDLEEGYFENTAPQGPKICHDVVKINDETAVLFSGCGRDAAGLTFTSSRNILNVTFYSDNRTQGNGFNATYRGLCEGNITVNDTLESPGYPSAPPEDVSCEWRVASENGEVIYIRPGANTSDSLYECHLSPLSWRTENEEQGEGMKHKQLCRNDSAIVTRSDVILTYDPRTSGKIWTGVLDVDFRTNRDCNQFCQNTDDCLQPRTLDVGDYRCMCPLQYSGFNCEVYTDPCTTRNCSLRGQCHTQADGQAYTCECQPQYTGKDCEIAVDPCDGRVCANGGHCVAVGEDSAGCECLPGFKPPDCLQDDSPCSAQPCHNGAVCTLRGQWDFICTCPQSHTGTLCTIAAGAPHCIAEIDDTMGSGISWQDTLAGHHDNQPCPAGVLGRAERNCMLDDHSPTGGLWRRPDLSECVSPVLLQLSRDSQVLREAGFEEDLLHNISRRLASIMSSLRRDSVLTSSTSAETIVTSSLFVVNSSMASLLPGQSTVTLYPGDLLQATDVLSDISVGVVNARTLGYGHTQLSLEFTQSLDSLLQPNTLDVWKNARVELVESKVTSLLDSAQHFTSNLVSRQSDVKDRLVNTAPVVSTLLRTTGDHVELLVLEWNDGSNNSLTPVFTPHRGTLQSSIVLPHELLQIARANGSKRSVRLYSGRFTSISHLLSLKEYRYTRNDLVNASKTVNSDVISAEVLGLPKSAFSRLKHAVQVTFHLTDSRQHPGLHKLCVFMNMTASDTDQRWRTDGCYLHTANSSHVTCLCYHLTNFAVLLDVFNNAAELDENNNEALSYISYIGGSLSILSALVVIVVFQYFRLSSDRVRIHEQLAAAIILVQVLFLIGVGRTAADDNTPLWACKTVAILMHYSVTSLFCWMLVEGLHIYVLLVKVFKRGSHLKKYCAIGWGVPLIVVGISVGVSYDKYGDGNLCWLNHELLLFCFVPTVSLVIVINAVILILVLRVMLRSLHSTAKANIAPQSGLRMSLKASAVLLPLLGLTWTLAFLTVDTGRSKVMAYIFTYLFTITNSFQGVMFFVFHCLLNADVHGAYERRYQRKKRPVSSLETTRKSSDMSYLTDATPTGKSTTKTNLSDMSVLHRRPSLAHGRFLLYDGHAALPFDPTHPAFNPAHNAFDPAHPAFDPAHPAFDPAHSAFDLAHSAFDPAHSAFDFQHAVFDYEREVTLDPNAAMMEDLQTSDTARIWRRCSVSQDASDNFHPYPTLHRSASSPTHYNMAAFRDSVSNLHSNISRSSSNPDTLTLVNSHSSDAAVFVSSTYDDANLDLSNRTSVHFT